VIIAMAAALACYGIACICSTFYYQRKHPGEFSLWKHAVVPGLGALAILFVLIGMFFPPHVPEIFDLIFVLIIALGFFISGAYLQRTKSKEALERTGAIVAGLVPGE
jgi:L-asparagine transporter-like permease